MIGLTVKTARLNQMPVKPVLSRLGYRESRSNPEEILPKYGPVIERFVNETQVRLFYRETPLAVAENGIRLGEYAIASRLLRERFQGAAAALLSAASVLPDDFARLQAFSEHDQLQEAVILDAVLSEKVDFGLDFIQKELEAELRRQGQQFGPRLSAGYGDFDLKHQAYFYKALDLQRYGVRLNENFILFPEKTVTAVTPIYS